MSESRSQSLHRRYRRALRVGLAVSLVAHVGLFLTFDDRSLPRSPFAAAGEARADDRAALGGGMQAVELRGPPEPAPTPPEEVPAEVEEAPEEEPPEPTIEDLGPPTIALADQLMLPGAAGVADVPGLLDASGLGDAGTAEEGRFRGIPPRPRGMILPPGDRPDRVRGQEIEVWVWVSPSGEVVPDSTRLHPSTGDRRFDRRLREHAAGWRFEAARRDGRPIGEWFRYTIIM